MKRRIVLYSLGLIFFYPIHNVFAETINIQNNYFASTRASTQSSTFSDETKSSNESNIKNNESGMSANSTSDITTESTGKEDYSNTEVSEGESIVAETANQQESNYIDNTQYSISRSDLVSEGNLRKKLTRNELTLPAVSATNNDSPRKDFIDVSSHNGSISVASYQTMKKYGVKGVVVKLTEATSYKNPYAKEQIENAKKAGLNVSAYHYSWFTSNTTAIKEADYFTAYARLVGLDYDTIMVNDIEEPQISGNKNHTQNSLAFEKRLKDNGYQNVCHYTGSSWIDSGKINPAILGESKIWVASYFYSITSSHKYTHLGSWQWSPRLSFPGVKGEFDISADYSNYFTSMNPTVLKNGTSVTLKKDTQSFVSGKPILQSDRQKAYIIQSARYVSVSGVKKVLYTLKGTNEQVYNDNITPQTSNFSYISLGKSVSIKQSGKLNTEGEIITNSERKKVYTIKAVKDIPKKYNSIRAYQLKENTKWYYEADIQEQISSYPQYSNNMSYKLKNTANLFVDGSGMSAKEKKNIGIISNVISIPKKYGSVRAYKDLHSGKYIYEADLIPLHNLIPNNSSVVIKSNAYYYQNGQKINKNDKNKAYIISETKEINQKYDSIRAYRIRNTNKWFYESDISCQTSIFPYVSLGTRVYLKNTANLDYNGKKIIAAERNKPFSIKAVRDIPKKYGSIRIYQDSKTSRWFYEADIQKIK
ncbi:GH25 family lysozyme [Enterococcus dispar]|uniref:GH25 family lysozyme n=2 Tax=Enterococcus dispar TaxID=44009 RepID=UPI0021D40B8B|nr:GH25 family lysozyme [Enterococcus dispar]MCU7356350.1 GH25 family lysozyme [Enterococcus dispar]